MKQPVDVVAYFELPVKKRVTIGYIRTGIDTETGVRDSL